MNIKLIIFDLDGTLVNSIPDLTDSLNHVAKLKNKTVFDERQITDIVGGGIVKLIENTFHINKEESCFNNYFDEFMKHHENNYSNRSHLYNQALDVLEYYKSKKLAILSNKIDYLTKQVAIDFKIDRYFDIILGATDGLPKKPSGEPILHILNELNILPTEAIMVGDSEPDIISAKNAGIKTVALTCGYRSKEQLEKLDPDFIIDDIIDLKSIIM